MKPSEKKKIFIIEEDDSVVSVLRDCLPEKGYEILGDGKSPKDFSGITDDRKPDILLVGVSLNKLDEAVLYRELTNKFNIPVVFIISALEEEYIDKYMSARPDGFLIKPFDTGILKSVLEISFSRYKSKKELFEVRELLSSTLESIEDTIFTIDNQGFFQSVYNDKKEQLLFYSPVEFIGKRYKDVLPVDISKQLDKAILSLTATRNSQKFEYDYFNQGKTIWYQAIVSLRHDPAGKVIGYTAAIKDITQTKTDNELLLLLSHAVNQNSNAIVVTNTEGQISYVNKKYLEMKGYSDDEVIGTIAGFYDPKLMGIQNGRKSSEALKNYKGWRGEIQSERKDGSVFWEYLTVSPIRDKNGNVTHYMGVSEDISRRKQLENQVWESQQKLLLAQNMARLGTCELDLIQQTAKYNELFGKVLRLTKPLKSKHFMLEDMLSFIPQNDQPKIRQQLLNVTGRRIPDFKFDITLNDPLNNEFNISLLGRIKYNIKEAEKIFIVITDITERKQHERLLNEIEISRKNSEFKQKLYSALSHEIRTPLSGIQGIISLLLKSQIDIKQKDYVDTLQASVNMMMDIINDFLDLSKIESGKMPVKLMTFNIERLMEQVVNVFAPLAEDKNIKLNLLIPKDFPRWLLTDEKRIFQITSNLVSNAVKFTSEGKVDIRLSLLEIKENRGRICIEVEDTGIGITEDEKTLLFNEFSQLNKGTLEMQQGSGLGLSICKKFVNLLGGQIDVESKEGEGSVFWFDLPVVIEEQQPQDVQNEPVRLSREEDEKFKKTSILLVDDKVVNQKVIGLMLESMGCQVKYASNGQEALKIFQESQINAFNIFGGIHFDIIFLDIRMPILDGFQTIEQLRSNYSDLPPIVALSANSLPEEIAEYQEAGFEDYLIKPVTLEDLERIIKKWVVQKQKMQDLRSGKSNNELKEDFIKTPIVNKHTLDVILNTIKGDQGILFQLIDTFVEDMDRIHEKIQQAMATDDVASLQLLILTTKGLSGNMGASQLHEISMYIDKCFREEMTEKALEMIPFLMERYFILKTELSVYYSSLSLSNS